MSEHKYIVVLILSIVIIVLGFTGINKLLPISKQYQTDCINTFKDFPTLSGILCKGKQKCSPASQYTEGKAKLCTLYSKASKDCKKNINPLEVEKCMEQYPINNCDKFKGCVTKDARPPRSSKSYKKDLKDWDISRHSPYFGFEIPGYKDKFFYVWLDAPIGYLASHINYLNKQDSNEFEKFWDPESSSEIYHFIGKDIMYFHTLFFPVMLSNADFKRPSGVFAHGFLTLDGEKMSKSRGNFISADDFVKTLDPEYLRYYFASKLSTGVDDIDLNLEDLKQKVNSDLVNKLVNIASRSANFLKKHYNNELSKEIENDDLINEFIRVSKEVFNHYENLELNKAMKEIMAL